MKNFFMMIFLLTWPCIAFTQNGISVRNSDLAAIAIILEIQYCGQVYPEFKNERDNYLEKLKNEIPEMMRNNKYIEAVLADKVLGSTADWKRPVTRDECNGVINDKHHLQLIKKYFAEEQSGLDKYKGKTESVPPNKMLQGIRQQRHTPELFVLRLPGHPNSV